MATVAITVGVINGDTDQDDIVGLDAKGLHGSVLDIEAGDTRVVQVVSIEELGLGLAAIGALAVPPARTATVDDVVRCSANGDVRSGDTDEGAVPLLVSEGSLAAEDNLLPRLDGVPYYIQRTVILTLVPSSRSERSRVSPAGTSILSSIIVMHDFWLSLASAAEENVQVALSTCLEAREGVRKADATDVPRDSIQTKTNSFGGMVWSTEKSTVIRPPRLLTTLATLGKAWLW